MNRLHVLLSCVIILFSVSFLYTQDMALSDTTDESGSLSIEDAQSEPELQNDHQNESDNDELESETLSEDIAESTDDTEKAELSIITIKNALKTSYITDEESDTDTIRFSGDVIVSVEKGNSETIIFSDLIDFDRSRNILYAEGSVQMQQSTDGKITETLTAQSLLFNTSTLEGVFNQGRVVQEQQESLNLSDGSVLIVSSELFARGASDTITFKSGELTFCDDENPHWKIKASRIWLLPGNEFAFANALLYVGVVPVMYFPFFYYPKDELVFNPAFGFRSREGLFIQTTTYLIGRKPLSSGDDDSVAFSFMQQNQLKEQELQGLILRNLDENATMPSNYLKFMADYYSVLGGMVGLEGYFEPNSVLKNIGFNVEIGLSNVTFPIYDFPLYTSYYGDQKYPDYSWFFGHKLPFRYSGFFETDISVSNFSLSIDIPLYSDPWFEYDFGDRQESMDWIDFVFNGGTIVADDSTDDSTGITGYTWDLSASYKPNVSSLSPWITGFSLSSLNSAVVFATQETPLADFDNSTVAANSPNREFFYPSQIKPVSFDISLQGTLFEWNNNGTTASSRSSSSDDKTDVSEKAQNFIGMLKIPDELDSAIEIITESDDISTDDILDNEGTAIAETDENPDEVFMLAENTLPNISITKPLLKESSTMSYSLNYTINPEFSLLYTYSGSKNDGVTPISPSDIVLDNPKSAQIYAYSPVTLSGTLNAFSSLVSLTNSFKLLPQYQNHFILAQEYYTESETQNIIENDFLTRSLDFTNTNALSLKPFIGTQHFANSSVTWNTSVYLVKSEFIGTVDEPSWDFVAPKWDEESMITHNISTVLKAEQNDFSQTLTVQSNLPPLVDSYIATTAFAFPVGSITATTGYTRQSLLSDEWYFQPFVQSSSWNFFAKTADGKDNPHKITLAQSFKYNIEDEYADSLSASISWQGLQFSYNMLYSNSYSLDTSTGWVASAEKNFIPSSLALKWTVSDYELKNKSETISIKPGIATTLQWDMIIPTQSYFSFSPSISLDITDFLTLTFSSESRNEELVRYMQNIIGFSAEIPGERNIFLDLMNSFAFWDEEKRTSSGFKLQSFNIALEHDLHDWTLACEFEIEPQIITDTAGNQTFDYSPYFTLSVLWKPMSAMKTTIEDKYGTFTLNPAE
ncbi:MAG: hypothetical protein R3Y36_01925 [Spirochaetales bacterium]